MGQRFLTVKEVAELLRMSEQTIYNQINRRAKRKFPIPCKRVGRKRLFDANDVEEFMAGA
ncbi:MAG: helix-turn-helix domain-containing protein [Desulfobacterales bacterium]|jgi:excisionase family DNA binding protein|nr:helix-turn-helix domain-containing protein [Desulfobacterales bacterium]